MIPPNAVRIRFHINSLACSKAYAPSEDKHFQHKKSTLFAVLQRTILTQHTMDWRSLFTARSIAFTRSQYDISVSFLSWLFLVVKVQMMEAASIWYQLNTMFMDSQAQKSVFAIIIRTKYILCGILPHLNLTAVKSSLCPCNSKQKMKVHVISDR